MELAAFLVLRIIIAWLFLFPLKVLLSDWPAAVDTVKLVAPIFPGLFAVLMVLVMIVGAVSILLGAFAQVGAALLLIYCLVGVVVHYKLAGLATQLTLSESASKDDRAISQKLTALAVLGNQTSGQKNIVIAAALFFILMIGSGPFSLTSNLF